MQDLCLEVFVKELYHHQQQQQPNGECNGMCMVAVIMKVHDLINFIDRS